MEPIIPEIDLGIDFSKVKNIYLAQRKTHKSHDRESGWIRGKKCRLQSSQVLHGSSELAGKV
ncbi:hypothetical protein, partial [uncultured Allobaculum sp.]|uniref:hypothetical protein n=1 Tax=uncultured Allobaculum sp. TaxID=1187017 RepID=UPI0026EE3C90